MPSIMDSVKSAISGKDSDEVLLAKLDRFAQSAEGARSKLDWKWFNYDLWVAGNHYAKWDKNTQQIISSQVRADGKSEVVINKIYLTLRAVRSHVLQNRPKAEVTPYNLTPENTDQAVTLNEYLDYLHDRLGMRQKLRASLWHALKYSVGFWQVLYDEDESEGEGQIVVNVVDPFDLLWDPVARYPKEARYCILSVRRNIQDLREDEKYKDADWDEIQGDKALAASSLKSRMLQYEKGAQQEGKDDGTVIVREFWYKEQVEVKDPETGEKKKQTKIMLCAKAGGKIIRKPFDTGLNRFPFFRLCSDIEPLQMYGTGWVKNLIPVNKLLNQLESSMAEYNDIVNKGRFHVEKGAGLKQITNEHGQILETKKGYTVNPIPVPPMSPATSEQIINANRYIEDLGALHDASVGRQSSSDQSGRSIEALQEGDSNNLSELTENTEEFLEDVYEYILYLASQKYQFARQVTTTTQTGERNFIKLIGEGAQDETKTDDATVIPEKNIVDIKISSGLAYTAEGRRQAMKDLVSFPQMQNIPPEIILQAYTVGPIADIVKKMREEQAHQMEAQQQQQLQEQQMQTDQQGQQAQQQAQVAQQQQQGQQDAQTHSGAGAAEAIAFIRMVINGQKPEIPENVSPEFVNYLDEFIKSPEGQSVGGTILSVLQQDRDQAMLQIRGSASQVSNVN
jgi:hypothetical protein